MTHTLRHKVLAFGLFLGLSAIFLWVGGACSRGGSECDHEGHDHSAHGAAEKHEEKHDEKGEKDHDDKAGEKKEAAEEKGN